MHAHLYVFYFTHRYDCTRGLYCLQLEPWLAAFGDQVKVLSLSQLSQSREVTQSREVQVLSVDDLCVCVCVFPSLLASCFLLT